MADEPKLVLRVRDGGPHVALHLASGQMLPAQERVTLHSCGGDLTRVTVTFVVDNDDLRLEDGGH